MRKKSLLARAVERKDWDVVALCLLVGLVDAASRLPPEAIEDLLGLLEVRDRHGEARG